MQRLKTVENATKTFSTVILMFKRRSEICQEKEWK